MKAVTESAAKDQSGSHDGNESFSPSTTTTDVTKIEGSKKVYDLSLAEDLIDLLKKKMIPR